MTRRHVLTIPPAIFGAAFAAARTGMKIQLSCGSIGVKASQLEAIEYGHRFGFEAIEANTSWLASQGEGELKRIADDMKAKGLVWGNGGLTVEFRKGDDEFRNTIKDFPAAAAALQKTGVTRVTTWISPSSDTLTYLENFKVHAARLRECAKILGQHGCRLGLEYVGPKTLWTSKRYAFIHNMREMKELIAEMGQPNVGFVMDSWHWFTAGENAADLATLTNKDVVSIDMNDAPAGIPLDKQIDSAREIPLATGVIPMGDFLNTLNKIGCDAPARCEPFNAALRAMPPDQALKTTIDSMKKAFGLIS